MKKLRVYIETSVVSFVFADDSPEKRETTRRFFKKYIRANALDAFISKVVTDEIGRTRDRGLRDRLLGVVRRYPLAQLPFEPRLAILDLAQAYVKSGVIPKKKADDALHVAVCTVHEMDVLVSWNYEHLVNVNKERRIAVVNQACGYIYPLRIATPLEVMGSE